MGVRSVYNMCLSWEFVTQHYMTYPDVYRKIMFTNSHNIWGGKDWGVNFHRNFWYKSSEMSRSAQNTDVWQPPNMEVLGTAHQLFCV